MKVYLAASFSWYPELIEYDRILRRNGHSCTSGWLYLHDKDQMKRMAEFDIEDINRSEIFVLFSEPKGEKTRGGKHFETGYAYARGLPIIVVGEKEHIFHELDGVEIVKDWPEALRVINRFQRLMADLYNK